ncbi:methionine synthase [Enterococcus faecium]|nr:methionine synthase [Enterococcus faecium]
MKNGELEEHQQVIDRIYEATRYLPLDRLCLSPQCGFASTEEENVLIEEQWKKFLLSKALQKKFGENH